MSGLPAAGAERPAPAPPSRSLAGPPAPPLRDPDDLLADLDPDQRAVVEAVSGPVCVLAGAGTGKTRAITARIGYAVLSGAVPVTEIQAVTFTTRAAGEMRTRLRALGVPGVQARTFHAAALRQLTYFYPKTFGAPLPRVVDSKLRLIARAATVALRRSVTGTDLRDLTGEVEWARATLTAPADYPAAAAAAHRQPPLPAAEVAAVAAAYEQVKAEAAVVDFEDLLLLAAAMMREDPRVAAEVRARYRYFVVDEYQDVNPAQQLLLDAWVGDREELCVVGDVGQTIYTFSGARPEYLLDFPRRFPAAQVVRLTRDYRSTPQVVALANAVRERGPERERLPLVAQRPPGPAPTFTEYADEPAEAEAVAEACARLLAEGVPAGEIAILYRVNAQSQAYESALAAAGVPYVVRGAERFFDRPEIRQALLLLRAAARFPADPADVDEPAASGAGLVPAVEAVLSGAGYTGTAPAGRGAARDRWESLTALLRLAADLVAAEPATGLADFVAELDDRAAAQHAPAANGVTLASLHAAKGLEWDAVFLVGLVDGTLPITYATTPVQVEEERRLLYVGITRARRYLRLSWARSRSAGGRRGRLPSRFLEGLRPATAARRRPGVVRVETAPGDVELVERLKGWRLERSRELRQPAFCVFTDATLRSIAAARPSSRAEMIAIPGVGATKLAAYADDVLALVRAAPSGSEGAPGPDREPQQ